MFYCLIIFFELCGILQSCLPPKVAWLYKFNKYKSAKNWRFWTKSVSGQLFTLLGRLIGSTRPYLLHFWLRNERLIIWEVTQFSSSPPLELKRKDLSVGCCQVALICSWEHEIDPGKLGDHLKGGTDPKGHSSLGTEEGEHIGRRLDGRLKVKKRILLFVEDGDLGFTAISWLRLACQVPPLSRQQWRQKFSVALVPLQRWAYTSWKHKQDRL